MNAKKIFLAADHAGFELKEHVRKYLQKEGFEVVDKGAFKFEEQDDYPDFIVPAAKSVAENDGSLGIIFGGSGQGEAMAANRIRGVRAALYYGHEMEIVKLSRTHNNANVLSLGARFLSKNEAIKAVEAWLGTEFSGEERHERRIKKIDNS